MNEVITLVAKGPSANHAKDWLEGDTATINNSARLIPGTHVNYCFFTHKEVLPSIEKQKSRIDCFVSPELTKHENTEVPDWLKNHIYVQYPQRECAGGESDLLTRISQGGITHHNTVNGALHWLSKHGKYRRIRIIGVDGGSEYANTVKPIPGYEATEELLNLWKLVTQNLCNLLNRIYAVDFEWYKP